MQATDFGNRGDGAELRRLDRPSVGCILVEREVSASPVIVREVRGEEASQVPLAQNDDMVQALAPDRADESLREGILPRAVRGRENFTDSHARHTLPEVHRRLRRGRGGGRTVRNRRGRRPRSAGRPSRRWDARSR